MDLGSARTRAPHKLRDSDSLPPSPQKQNHKRQRSQTLGTTFVSTTVVPAPSSSDVLSSLISSLTLLSDSAREQIRSAREHETPIHQVSIDTETAYLSPPPLRDEFDITASQHDSVFGTDDGDEAEPPVVGYTRSRAKDQRRPSTREKWTTQISGKDKAPVLSRSGSSHTTRRSQSRASSSIGVPSIDRDAGASPNNLVLRPSSGARSPLKMFFSTRQDDESIHSVMSSSRDAEVKSIKSFRTTKSKQSTRVSQEQEKEKEVWAPSPAVPTEPQSPEQPTEKATPEQKTYSPLSPLNRDDLGEHLIPSRRSSKRHSPSHRSSSRGRSISAGRSSSLHSKNFSTVPPELPNANIVEQPLEEEDSTLRRIRELQQAKEKRHLEWRKESRKSERGSSRTSRSRPKSTKESQPENKDPPKLEILTKPEFIAPAQVQNVEKLDIQTISAPLVHEISIPSPSVNLVPAASSPALSTPRRHKRSLSASLRRSGSSRYRPVEDLRSVSEQVEAFLTAPRLTQRIRHPRTGRTIAFSEVGDPDGFAVFCCVGMGLTRFVTSFYDDVAKTQRLRLITPDRPGIGESSPFPDNVCTPLAWVDDVAVICQTLNIDKFSLLAHSAGSIYALATALKMPDKVRGRIHLLAPWIPPSQFPNGSSKRELKPANLPMAHRLLSVLPAPFLRAANSRFLSATSASIEPKSSRGRKKDYAISNAYDTLLAEMAADIQSPNMTGSDAAFLRHSSLSHYARTPTATPPPYTYPAGLASPPASPSPTTMRRTLSISASRFRSSTPNEALPTLTPQARQALFDSELTHRTWALATLNANPAVDLLVCLERRRPIGFKYTDITRGVVVHHGRKDARVPLENAQWLSEVMKRCELRILDDEGHSLMASANVMSRVLAEMGREWEEWDAIAKDQEKQRRDAALQEERIKEMERRRFIREGH